MYIKCCFSFLSSSIWAFSSAFTLSSFSDSWGPSNRIIRSAAKVPVKRGVAQGGSGLHVIGVHQAGNGLQRECCGLPGTASPQSWDNSIRFGRTQTLEKPLNLEASSEMPLSFHSRLRAGCDSHGDDTAVEPMAQRFPSYEPNSPHVALLDLHGP